MKAINLSIRFLLELCALWALGYSGYHAVEPEAGRIALAIVAPLTLAIFWGLFAAHKAKFPPPRPIKALVGFLLLEAAAASLALIGQGELAGIFAAIIAANSALLYSLDSGVRRNDDA